MVVGRVAKVMMGSARRAARQSAVAVRSKMPVRRRTASVLGLPSPWAVAVFAGEGVGALEVPNAVGAGDVAAVGVEEVATAQREAQGVAAELLAGFG